MESNFENRLDDLRREAKESGRVSAQGAVIAGGPIPSASDGARQSPAGYYGRPVLKKPVWTWEVPVYFFVGGIAGMAAPLALAALLAGELAMARAAAWTGVAGAVVSSALLASDLGRPRRFIYMLRVFKWRSPMSVGAWILTIFGGCVAAAAAAIEWRFQSAGNAGGGETLARASLLFTALAVAPGVLLATYTGVLLGVTATPVWFSHRRLLPLHFGTAALGSSAALLILLGFKSGALPAIGMMAAAVETAIAVRMWLGGRGVIDAPLRSGWSGRLIVTAEILSGPLALALWLAGAAGAGACSFLLGSFVSRWGWLMAGRRSAEDPNALFAAQGRPVGGKPAESSDRGLEH